METNYLVKGGFCDKLDDGDIADPDVTGWGVVTSFIISIVMNMAAILIAYAKNSLPRKRYNFVDDIAHRKDQGASDDERARGKRVQAFEQFMLAMSDQQLITGMALILTTTFILAGVRGLNGNFSVYSFQVATRLGYFSCIIHLCSLSILRNYFDKDRRLMNLRAVLMVIFLILLITCMIISDSVTFRFNRHVSVTCAMQHFKFIDRHRPSYVSFSDEVIIVFNLMVLVYILVAGYIWRLLEIYHRPARRQYNYWRLFFLRRIFGSAAETNYSAAVAAQISSLDDFLHRHAGSRPPFQLRQWLVMWSIWTTNIESSFLWEIVWLLFYFVFGIANLLKFFVDASVHIGRVEPNFGQLVPLFLLLLPLLTAYEAYSSTTAYSPLPGEEDLDDSPPSSFTDLTQSEIPLAQVNHSSGIGSPDLSDVERGPAEVSSLADQTEQIETTEATKLRSIAEALHISPQWLLRLLVVPYASGLILWALIFADVILGGFYLSIVACIIALIVEVIRFFGWFNAARVASFQGLRRVYQNLVARISRT